MHRITVVTRGSPEVCNEITTVRESRDVVVARSLPSSPLPGLEVSSDDSSREEPGKTEQSNEQQKLTTVSSFWWNSKNEGSPVRSLEAGSEDRPGLKEDAAEAEVEPKRPARVSNWRKRGLRKQPSLPDLEDPVSLDLSVMKRRDLPIKLVVDDPMPAGKYYGDPYADTTTNKYFSLGKKKESIRESHKSRDVSAASPVSVCDQKFVFPEGAESGEVHTVDPTVTTESWLVPFDQGSKSSDPEGNDTLGEIHTVDPAVTTESWLVPFDQGSKSSDPGRSKPQAQECRSEEQQERRSESSRVAEEEEKTNTPANPTTRAEGPMIETQDIIRCNGPVVRIEYEGEMVSVSEQTAAKLKEGECAWV